MHFLKTQVRNSLWTEITDGDDSDYCPALTGENVTDRYKIPQTGFC